jgi:hypothetical protein
MKNVQQKRCHDFESNDEPKQTGKKAATMTFQLAVGH